MAKDEAKKENAYDAWKKVYEKHVEALSRYAAFEGGKIAEKRAAGAYAQQFYAANGMDPLNLVGPDSMTDINEALGAIGEITAANARKPFVEGLEGILADAPEKGLVARYQAYMPQEKNGDTEHNDKVKSHKSYLEAIALQKKASEGDEAAGVALKGTVEKAYRASAMEKLEKAVKGRDDWNDEAKTIAIDAAKKMYERKQFTDVELLKAQADYFTSLKKGFEGQFKDDKDKAAYARNNLIELVKKVIGDGKDQSKVSAAMASVYEVSQPVKKAD